MLAILIIIVLFFAMNMGASGLAPSFAILFGAKQVEHKKAVLWFTAFVIIGAVLGGHNVVKTLGGKIIPAEFMSIQVVLIALAAAVAGLFIANLIKVPQSTSWATVFAISGAGLAMGHLKFETLLMMVPFWLVLPILGFIITYFLYKIIYPPRFENLWIYQKFLNNETLVKRLAFFACCYIAFAAGSNNVANAVGPLFGAGLVSPFLGLLAVAPFFGLGALWMGKGTMATTGKEIVPLGLISSILVGVVSASLLVFASYMGIPQSLVQLNALSIMAIGAVKHERHIFNEQAGRKVFLVWLITPLVSFTTGFLLTKIFL